MTFKPYSNQIILFFSALHVTEHHVACTQPGAYKKNLANSSICWDIIGLYVIVPLYNVNVL